MGEERNRGPLLLAAAGAWGGFLVGLAEAGGFHYEGRDIGLAAVDAIVMRDGLLGGALFALAALAAAVVHATLRRRRLLVTRLTLALILACGVWLVLDGRVSSDSTSFVSLFFLCAGAVTPILAWRAMNLRRKGAPARALFVLPVVIAALLVVWDPANLRGTYRPLDLLMSGAALAMATCGCLLVPLAVRLRPVFGIAVLGMLAAMIAFGSRSGLDALLDASPRLRFMERAVWIPLGLGKKAPGIQEISIDEGVLFAPPEDPALTRARWAARKPGPMSVLWITIDALRPEVTGLGGGQETPVLDRFTSLGLGFKLALAQGPGTFVSTESMFRSRMPGSRYPPGLDAASPDLARRDFPTLAGMLSEAGWQTVMVSGIPSAELQTPMFRLIPAGFQKVIPSAGPTDAVATAKRVQQLLLSEVKDRFFLWVHLFDPHMPYVARSTTTQTATPRERWLSEIRYADGALGNILDSLREAGRAANTIVVINADHAEAFGEHGRYYHATSFFNVQIHVPLAIHVPGLRSGVTDSPVGNVDIIPTILDLLQLEIPEHVQGTSLLPLLMDPTLQYPRAAFAESLNFSSTGMLALDRVRVVTDGAWKLMHYVEDGFTRLFDLREDPGEARNLAAEHPDQVARLRGYLSALDRHLGRARAGTAVVGPPKSLDALISRLHGRSLGGRTAAMLEIATTAQHTMTARLEQEVARLDPDTAHVLLATLDASFMADAEATAQEIPVPERPGPLRFRVLERYSRLARYQPLPVPALPGTRNSFDEHARSLARAARGSKSDQAALKHIEPASRILWNHLAPALAMGGDEAGGGIVAAAVRGHYPGPRVLVRALRTLLRARSPLLSQAIVDRWPSDEIQISHRFYSEFVDALCENLDADWIPGAFALHPGAPGSKQEQLEVALGSLDERLVPKVLSNVGREWTHARRLEKEREGREQLRNALDALPRGFPIPSLDAEFERSPLVEVEPGAAPELLFTVTGIPGSVEALAPGPPRVRVEAAAGAEVPLGRYGFESVLFRWVGPETVDAARLSFGRYVIRQGRALEFPLPIDYPRRPGSYRLTVGWNDHRLRDPTGSVRFEVPQARSWEGPVIARLFKAPFPQVLPLRLLEDAAGIEFGRGLGSTLEFPPLDLAAGELTVSVTFTAWTTDEKPVHLGVRVEGEAIIPVGSASPGARVTLVGPVTIPTGGARRLTLVWPDRSALLAVERIELRQ